MTDQQANDNQHTPREIRMDNHFKIVSLYLKSLSFSSPESPQIFFKKHDKEETDNNWNVEVNIGNQQLDDTHYDVSLKVTVTMSDKDKKLFTASVIQSGVFLIDYEAQSEIDFFIACRCPDILLPYAREALTGLTAKGNFPPFHLHQIDFAALFSEHQRNKQSSENVTLH